MRTRWLVVGSLYRSGKATVLKPRREIGRSPVCEILEDRQLLAASLGPIANLNVPALQGFTQPFDGSGTTDPQTFSASSSNPDVKVSIESTTFWNIGVSYTDPVVPANSFSGTITFGLFGNLTPNTVNMITQFTNDSYYVNSGKFFARVVTDYAGSQSDVIQGGAANAQGNGGNSGQPGTPFANENLQQLAPTGFNQLLMANSGGTDTNDTQFFIDSGPLNAQLGYSYTVFGQLVSGAATLAKIESVPVQANFLGEPSQPVYPITITSTSLTSTNSNGVVLLDTTQAHPGETATVTVTANDGVDNTHAQQSFQVTVGQYSGSTSASSVATVNFKPYVSNVVTGSSIGFAHIQLEGQATFPAGPATVSSYSILSGPAHGTISNFDPTTGTLTYTPAAGFAGTDTFTYSATSSGPNSAAAAASSDPATVSIVVTDGPLVYLKNTRVSVKKNKVSEIILSFSGPLGQSIASSKSPYQLRSPNRKGLYSGRGSSAVKLKSVKYDGKAFTVTLIPKTMIPKKQKDQLIVLGSGKSGLKDTFGRYIVSPSGQSGGSYEIIV
jgi:cyclophilin family peptidyl-prolyl cis-trans isomerase